MLLKLVIGKGNERVTASSCSFHKTNATWKENDEKSREWW